jgi:general secretion pathway protein G
MVGQAALMPRALGVRPRTRGFTMIELLVVMAVLGILAAAVMPLGEALLQAQKERDLRAALWQIRSAIDTHKRLADQGVIAPGPTGSGYPASLQVLVQGVADIRGGTSRVYLLRQVPRDPFASPSLPAEATWRLRSYASPPDDPQPGADVFDVRSSSDAQALDGSFHASW